MTQAAVVARSTSAPGSPPTLRRSSPAMGLSSNNNSSGHGLDLLCVRQAAVVARSTSAPGSPPTLAALLAGNRSLLQQQQLRPRPRPAVHAAAATLYWIICQVPCPFLLDQFYWAERLHWLGVAPEPLKRQHLIPDTDDAASISCATDMLLGAIRSATSLEIKAQATRIANRLASEDGIGEALGILKEKVLPENKWSSYVDKVVLIWRGYGNKS